MALLAGFIVPHPPIIIPDIGRGEERKIEETVLSYQRIAKTIAKLKPTTIILITPHHLMYKDYFHISPGEEAYGSLQQFHSNEHFHVQYNQRFLKVFNQKYTNFPAGSLGETTQSLDHGVMIPLYFILKAYKTFKVVRITISGLSLKKHDLFGEYIKKTMDDIGEDYVVVASGDLSHKLKKSGPYGFIKEGPKFDNQIVNHMTKGDFNAIKNMDESLYQKAAECGLRSFVILGGLLKDSFYDSKLHSYEGSFGVGYAVASYTISDPYVWLAKKTVKHYLNHFKKIPKPKTLPREMLNHQAGVFVSLKIEGQLRGCIGTIQATTDCIADEIIQNAISAAFRDPRFSPLRSSEFDKLTISVDVLKAAEQIDSPSQLDVNRYGVIVKSGFRSGLLLPNLDGVDSVEDQINIALSKAGIYQGDDYELSRFEVIRHQ